MRGKTSHRANELRRKVLSDPQLQERYIEQRLISELGGILDRAMQEHKLTQTAAADLLGMRQPDLNALLRGRAEHLPTLRSLWRLAKGLGLHLVIDLEPSGAMRIRQQAEGEETAAYAQAAHPLVGRAG